ncbi:PIR Superfamily Protein [Plasmodium ovale wallikeri]|uniref:PIR Superfamily Protein n=1 Tax=Plasmodium ovale wallikeri TaxID=864142 RepID=A0A1A9APP9_PLAOA|nr:PIR Superfamily Protein [Plasmodium ovale wallikeri]SBT58075.1 PIR Superfamily Protein [Plasmodium ovale wallikeri]
MDGNDLHERFDSFDEYSSNNDLYDEIKLDIWHLYDSFPNEVIPQNITDRNFIVNDCLRLRKYLLEFVNKEGCQTKNCCAYVNYLLNSGIRSTYKSQKYIFKFYTKYMNHDVNQDIKKLCGHEIIDMHEEKYSKTKKLYDVYYLYKIFNTSTRGTQSCYLAKSCASKYNNIITDYPNLDDTEFCKALNDFKTIFEKNTIISSQCYALYPDELSLLDTCSHLQRQSEYIDLPLQQPDGQVTKEAASGKQSFPEAQQTESVVEDQSSSSSSSGSTLPIALFSSGIGILLILLSSYKFTPFGQLLRLKIQKFKGTSDHLDGEQYEMQQNYSEYDEGNAEYNGYNISYNSL